MKCELAESRPHRRLVDMLYVEAMVLANEARGYFDEYGRIERDALVPLTRVAFSCESLKVTTRLMHIIAWLLTQRAVAVGELEPEQALDPSRRLGVLPTTAPSAIDGLPLRAQMLIEASIDLHRRVGRFDSAQAEQAAAANPVLAMRERLALAF